MNKDCYSEIEDILQDSKLNLTLSKFLIMKEKSV